MFCCLPIMLAFPTIIVLLYQLTFAHSMGTLLHAGPSCIIKPRLEHSFLNSPIKHRGICYSTLLCKQKGGVAIGKCGLGNSCCIFPQSCNSISVRNSTYFTNPDYPEHHNRTEVVSGSKQDNEQCSLTIHRMPGIHPICQFRLDFIEYNIENLNKILDPEGSGKCDKDTDWISLKAMHTDDQIVEPICPTAKNGQHVIVDISKHLGPFVLTVNTGAKIGQRRWNILINQIECTPVNYQVLNIIR